MYEGYKYPLLRRESRSCTQFSLKGLAFQQEGRKNLHRRALHMNNKDPRLSLRNCTQVPVYDHQFHLQNLEAMSAHVAFFLLVAPALHGGNWWEDCVLISSTTSVCSANVKLGNECCNLISICCKRRLRVVVVFADIFEAIMPVRTSNHYSEDDIRVCFLTLLPFCTSFAPVLNTVIRDRCPSVMNIFGVLVSKTDNVRSIGFFS